MTKLEELLELSASRHNHLCLRQVLGVRMGLCAANCLGLELPQEDKRLFTFIETDGCLMDGVSVSTGCWAGRRTMRVMDFGKMAATFIDTVTGKTVRIAPHPNVRLAVKNHAQQPENHWHAYLLAYQSMPLEELLVVQPVKLIVSMRSIISCENARAYCQRCGEEIFNEREVRFKEQILCKACAGQAYYGMLSDPENHRDVLTSVSEGVICKSLS